MKIALECQSLLLQDTLRFYLSDFLCDVENCDFIVSDYLSKSSKPVFCLSSQVGTLPFVPEDLNRELKIFYQKNCDALYQQSPKPSQGNDERLRSEIQALLMEFADRFLQTIKKYR